MKNLIIKQANFCPFNHQMLEGNEWKNICSILFEEAKGNFYCTDSFEKNQTKFPPNCPLIKEKEILVKRAS